MKILAGLGGTLLKINIEIQTFKYLQRFLSEKRKDTFLRLFKKKIRLLMDG